MVIKKWQSSEKIFEYKRANKKTGNKLNKFTERSYPDKVSSNGFVSDKSFWKTVTSFSTSKEFVTNEDITTKY